MRRILLALLLFLTLAPLPGSQRPPAPFNDSQIIVVRPVPQLQPGTRFGALTLAEAWELSSDHSDFGGFSGMIALPQRRFALISDGARRLRFDLSRDGLATDVSFHQLPPPETRPDCDDCLFDAEAMALDPATGDHWIAFEGLAQIWAFTADDRLRGRHFSPILYRWRENGSSESLARLPGGQFIVLSESIGPSRRHEGVKFASDPTVPANRSVPTHFFYDPAGQGDPTDATTLPDGRVIIVHRQVGLNPVFRTSIAIADPRGVQAGQTLTSRPIAVIRDARLAENYEGSAVTQEADGLSLWLVSDDNQQDWQRTRLVRFIIDPAQLDPAKRAAPSPARP